MTRKYTRHPEHNLTEINTEARFAVCDVCGPTRLRFYMNGSGVPRPVCWVLGLIYDGNTNARVLYPGQVFEEWKKAGGFCQVLDDLGVQCANPIKFLDHDHVTGFIRRYVCIHHNLIFGHAKDSPSFLRGSAEYLEHFEEILADVPIPEAPPQLLLDFHSIGVANIATIM